MSHKCLSAVESIETYGTATFDCRSTKVTNAFRLLSRLRPSAALACAKRQSGRVTNAFRLLSRLRLKCEKCGHEWKLVTNAFRLLSRLRRESLEDILLNGTGTVTNAFRLLSRLRRGGVRGRCRASACVTNAFRLLSRLRQNFNRKETEGLDVRSQMPFGC